MGATYFYLPEDALFVTAYWGRAELAESNEMRKARAADPARKDARAHIIDLSEYGGSSLSKEAEAALFEALGITYAGAFAEVPTIVIAKDPHIFGQARVFEKSVGLQPRGPGVKVVRTWKEAGMFLGTDLAKVQEEIHKRQATDPPAG